MTEPMTVDQLLAQQNEAKSLATIEAVEGKPDQVKLTPWVPSEGCRCASSLVIPKAAIASVTPTGAAHHCCGKTLAVVEVVFTKGAQVAVADVVAQATSGAQVRQHPRRRARAAADGCDGCSYAGQVYALGSVVCMSHSMRECQGGDGAPYFWGEIAEC